MLAELRQVIPAFLARVDQPNRGGRWIEYFADTRRTFDGRGAADRRRCRRQRPRDEVHADRLRPGRRNRRSWRRRCTPCRRCRTISCSRSRERMTADDRAALLRAYVGDRANRRHKPGRAFERTQLPLRRPRRLRRLPRSAAPSPADARVAAAQHAPRLHRAGRDRGGRRAQRLARGHGPVGGSARSDARARAPRRRALRRRHGVPRPLLHGHERPRGDARHRAAHRAAGTSRRTAASAS